MAKRQRDGRMEAPFIGRAWHPDGTPFTRQDYLDAGLDPPTDEQLIAWAENDERKAAGE